MIEDWEYGLEDEGYAPEDEPTWDSERSLTGEGGNNRADENWT